MKVVILAGGLGTRISEESHLKPKPMIEIGERPILWHIMKIYSHYGFHEFVICLGYKGNLIKEFFADYYFHMSDVTFDLTRGNEMTIHNNVAEPWKVTLVDTGLQSMTGARLSRVRRYLDDGPFMMTYGDGVGDICIPKLLEFHRKTGRKATLTGIQLGARFGVVDVAPDSDIVRGFQEKPREEGAWINGGFMVLEPSVLDYVHDDSGPFEKVALERLSREGELAIYRHAGFWQCMDTQRDKELLEGYWNSGRAQWKVWGGSGMRFVETALRDVLLIEPQPNVDGRGYFSRAFCQLECAQAGITCHFVQDNLSYNERAGTFRGMHFQKEPYGEDKLLRCIAGGIDDVIVDLRPGSPTYRRWEKYRLTAENGRALFIPKGFAHGYVTLCGHTSVYYKVSQFYHPEAAGGIRWDDPAIGITWDLPPEEMIMSEQDRAWPPL